MDSIDRSIMNIIRLDARIANVSIARRLGLAPSVVLDRMRKLKRNGYIRGFETRFDDAKLGLLLTAFVELDTGERIGETGIGQILADMPEVREVYDVAGACSYLLKVVVRDTEALRNLMSRIGQIEGVEKSKTTLVLHTIKDALSAEIEVESPGQG